MRILLIALALLFAGVSGAFAATPTPTLIPKTDVNRKATDFKAMTYQEVAVDPAQINAGACGETTVLIASLQQGDMVVMSYPASLEDGLVYSGTRIIGNNQLNIRLCNHTGGNVNGAARTWSLVWWDRTPENTGLGVATPIPGLTNTPTQTPTSTNTSTPTVTPTP